MRQDIAEKWVAALESGKYVQGKGLLRDTDGKYCCLGVLCDLAVEEGIVSKVDDGGATFYGVDATPLSGRSALLPSEVMAWSGMAFPDGFMPSQDLSLTMLNDTFGREFDQIAEMIRTHASEL